MSDEPLNPDAPSAKWLDRIDEAGRVERTYQDTCDVADRWYADLERLAGARADREYQMFYANMEVLRPTIYSRAPVPVVSSRFNDRKDLPRRTADILERALNSDFEADQVHDHLILVRDDLLAGARGQVWLGFKERDGYEVPCVYHVDRKDFRHDPARKWEEVKWVSRRSWNTEDEVKKRFGSLSGIQFEKQDIGGKKEGAKKAQIWELWDKPTKQVLWLSPGVEEILDKRKPWFDLTGFFPCPKPAYGVLQRRTLIPIPDWLFYKDQCEEINELTQRIAAMQEALRVKALVAAAPGSQAEIGDAVERALQKMDPGVWVEVVPNLGNLSIKDIILFVPIAEIATAIRECVELRRVLIDDVYQITGLSDIMRGETDANETLGAQQLKSQYGSVRVKERQSEMVRIARDITRMKAEMFAENVDIKQLLQMAQVDDLPSDQDIQQQAQQIAQQAEQQMVAAIYSGAPDEQGMQIQQQAQQQIDQLKNTVTVEKVAALLKDQRIRPFVLDIETDSTIEPDQIAEKEQRVEFATAMGPMLQQAMEAMQLAPQLGPFVAESLRFMASGFKVDRRMDEAIDELAEQLANYQPPEADPAGVEAAKAQAEQIKAEGAKAKGEADIQVAQIKFQQEQMKAQEEMKKAPLEAEKVKADIELIYAKIEEIGAKIGLEKEKIAIDGQQAKADIARNDREQQIGLAEKKAKMEHEGAKLKSEREHAEAKMRLERDSAASKFDLERRKMAAETAASEKAAKPRVRRTKVTKHDDRGRILEFETSDD